MHPSILAQRKANAIQRIVESASALATERDLDPALVEALTPKGVKDTQAAEMMRFEGLANLLEQLAPRAVTAVTPTHPVDEPVEDPRPTLDDFPAHVVEAPAVGEEDDGFEAKPRRRSTAKRTKKSSTG